VSDEMMFGIAKMPYEMAMGDEMSRRQFYANTQRLVAALEAARRNADMLAPPEGYALISVEVLRAWGKLDELRECCRYPKHATSQPAAVDEAMVERIAALLYEEATDEPWTVAGVEHPGPDRDYYRGLARKVAALAAMAAQGEDDAWCAECGVKLENVRPGKHQHPICSQAAPQQHAAGVGEER
jgi:hypothetical protein